MSSFRLQPQASMADDRQKQCVAQLTDRVLEQILRADPTKSRTDPDQLKRLVARRLTKMIPNFHTPVHPTYAFMIHRAIIEMKTEGGSDRESISEFMKKEYGDLPLAHESLLRSQLKKLCEKGEIFVTDCECYVLSLGDNVQKKQVMKEDGEQQVENNGVGGSQVKVSVLMENEAADGPHKVNVSSKQMKGRKQNGLLAKRRWSSRLQSKKPLEDETKEHCSELGEVVTKARGENDATRDQNYHAELSIADHRLEDQLFVFLDEPLEPPGFPSKKDQLIQLKQQAQADLKAFQLGVEVDQEKTGQQKIRAEDTLQADKDETNAGILQPGDCGKSMVREDQLLLSTDAVTMLAKPRSDAFSAALATCLPDDGQPDKQQIPMRRGRGRPRKQIPDAGSIVTKKQEKKQLPDGGSKKQEKKQGRGRPRKQKPDEPPEMEKNEVETIAENALVTGDHSQRQPKTIPIESSLEHTPYIKTEKVDEVQHISQQQKLNSAREGCSSNLNPGPAMIGSLSGPPSVCKTMKKNAAAPWDWEVVTKRVSEQNSKSVDDVTLASGSGSPDKEGTKKYKRIERPPKIDEDEHSGCKESPKVKRRRVKGCKSICYTNVSITDLVCSQDHHIQVRPMSRFVGRPKKAVENNGMP